MFPWSGRFIPIPASPVSGPVHGYGTPGQGRTGGVSSGYVGVQSREADPYSSWKLVTRGGDLAFATRDRAGLAPAERRRIGLPDGADGAGQSAPLSTAVGRPAVGPADAARAPAPDNAAPESRMRVRGVGGCGNFQCFLESAHANVEWVAERPKFRFVPAGPEAEDQPATADFVDRVRHFGQEGRITEVCADDDRSGFDTLGNRRQRRQDRPALPPCKRSHILTALGDEQVIRFPDGIEADFLGVPCHAPEVLPAPAFGPLGYR